MVSIHIQGKFSLNCQHITLQVHIWFCLLVYLGLFRHCWFSAVLSSLPSPRQQWVTHGIFTALRIQNLEVVSRGTCLIHALNMWIEGRSLHSWSLCNRKKRRMWYARLYATRGRKWFQTGSNTTGVSLTKHGRLSRPFPFLGRKK